MNAREKKKLEKEQSIYNDIWMKESIKKFDDIADKKISREIKVKIGLGKYSDVNAENTYADTH